MIAQGKPSPRVQPHVTDPTRPSAVPPPPPARHPSAAAGPRGCGEAEFAALVRDHRHRLLALALHITGSSSDAEDVVQDALLRAHRNMHGFQGRSQLFTWIYRITLNRALSETGRRGRRHAAPFDDDRVSAAVEVDAGTDPRKRLELRERYGQLVHALDTLTPQLRSTVVLVTLQGLSHREAGALLGVGEGTISWRVHEARRRLRRAMAKAPTRPLDRDKLPTVDELLIACGVLPAPT